MASIFLLFSEFSINPHYESRDMIIDPTHKKQEQNSVVGKLIPRKKTMGDYLAAHDR